MIRLFRRPGAGPVIVLVIASFALWLRFFISPPPLTDSGVSVTMPLWGTIAGTLAGTPLLAVLVSYLLTASVAVIMIRFNITLFFIPGRTLITALIYFILYAFIPSAMVLNPALPASLLIMAALWRMVSSYRIKGQLFNFFDAALLISTGGLLYAGALWFIPLVFIGVLIFRKPDLRELSLVLAGIVLPWLVMYGVWYVSGGEIKELSTILARALFEENPVQFESRTVLMLFIMGGVTFFVSLFYLFREMPVYKIRSRKTFSLFLWMSCICAVIVLTVPGVSSELLAIAALPVTFIIANYMAFTRRIIFAEILFWLLTVMLVISQLWP